MSRLLSLKHGASQTLVFAIGALAIVVPVFLILEPVKAIILSIGLVVVVVSLLQPIVGLWINLLANTSFQVLGSAHIIGAPASLSKMMGVVSIAAVLLHMMFAGWKATKSPMYYSLALFLIPVMGWDLMTNHPEIGSMEGTVRFVLMIFLLFHTSTIGGQNRRSLEMLVIGLFAAIAICGIIGLAEHFLPSLAIESDDPRLAQGAIGAVIDRESLDGVALKRITGGIGDANWLAYSVAMTLPLIVYLWHRWPGFWPRSLFSLMAALQLIALVYSFTRTGFLGLGLAFVYLVYRGVIPLRPILASSAICFAVALVALPQGFTERMFSVSYLKEGSTPLRGYFVSEAWQIFLEKPVFGHGYRLFGPRFYDGLVTNLPEDTRLQAWARETRKSVEDGRELVTNIGTHNLQLELLVEYGLFGALIYFSLFVVAWREAGKIEATGPPALRILAIALKASLLAFLACGLLGHAKYLKLLWLIFGILMAARRVSAVGDSPVSALLDWRRS